MKRGQGILVVFALASFLWRVGARAEPSQESVLAGPLSLEDAIVYTLGHNRRLLSALEERRIAAGVIEEARGQALPQVTLDVQYEHRGEELKFIVGGQTFTAGFRNDTIAELGVTQVLYEGGRVRSAMRAAELYYDYTDEGIRGSVQDAIYATTRAYYRVLLLQQEVEVAATFVRLSETHLKDVRTRRQFGVASDFNVLRSEVELSNARAEAIVFRNQLAEAKSDLFRILGASQSSDVTLTEVLNFTPVTPDEEEAVRQALGERPEAITAAQEVDLQREAIRQASSPWFPRLEAYFVEALAKPNPVVSNSNDWGDAWRAGFRLRFNLFDGLQTRGRVAQERAKLRQQEIDLDDTRERVKFEVRQALLSLRDAAEAVQVQSQTVTQADEGLRIAEVSYREGTLDQVAVLDARSALTRAKLLYFTALHAHAVARLDLERAKGTLLPPDQER